MLKAKDAQLKPLARTIHLVVEELSVEVLIYDHFKESFDETISN